MPFFLPPNGHNIYSCSSKTCFHERQWGWLLVVDFFTLHVPNFRARTSNLWTGRRNEGGGVRGKNPSSWCQWTLKLRWERGLIWLESWCEFWRSGRMWRSERKKKENRRRLKSNIGVWLGKIGGILQAERLMSTKRGQRRHSRRRRRRAGLRDVRRGDSEQVLGSVRVWEKGRACESDRILWYKKRRRKVFFFFGVRYENLSRKESRMWWNNCKEPRGTGTYIEVTDTVRQRERRSGANGGAMVLEQMARE
jgi:hypothetical protein